MDNLYWIVNEQGTAVKFLMNLVQKMLYLAIWYLNVVLKSRQHGITTFACIFFLDVCLFNPNISAAIIAHNKEDAEDFFQRNIKFAYDNLPHEIKSVITATQDSARRLAFSNGSSIRVTTSGRSGTYQYVHISELGKIAAKYPEKAREIKTGTLNTVHPGQFVIIESTAEGREGDFYDICKLSENMAKAGTPLTKMDFKFHFFPWYKNHLNVLHEPVVIKDYQAKYFAELEAKEKIKLRPAQKYWYVKKFDIQGDDMKREHPSTSEEAFEAAVLGAYYASQFSQIYKEGRITKVPYQAGILVDTWWDLGIGDDDSMAIWFTQDVGREIHVIRYYENSGEGMEFYRDLQAEYSKTYGYRYGRLGAPHDIRNRELFLNGKTRLEAAAKIGLRFRVAPKLSVISGIEQVRQILKICWFDEEATTMMYIKKKVGIQSLENYRKKWNDNLGAYRNTPLHNWASHGADAFRTMATLHQFQTPMGYEMGLSSPSGRTNIAKKDPGGWT
jgi:hypothetical protein